MTTLVVYADTTDGHIDSSHASTYATARAGTGTLTATSNITTLNVCAQTQGAGTNFHCWEGFLSFDTSSIGSGDTVSAATLSLYDRAHGNDGDPAVTIRARLHDWGASLGTEDWVAGASLSSKTLVAHLAFSSLAASQYYDFVDDALPANVNKTGFTRLITSHTGHENGEQPGYYGTASGSWTIWAADEDGTTSDPKLTITHAAGGASPFLILEDGSGAYEKEDSSGGIVLEA